MGRGSGAATGPNGLRVGGACGLSAISTIHNLLQESALFVEWFRPDWPASAIAIHTAQALNRYINTRDIT